MITIDHITKSFRGTSGHFWSPKTKVLDDISFDIPSESIIGFLGANGAGKTTLIKILLGLISSDSGAIKFDNVLGKNKSEIFSNISYLPERPYFYPHLTGREFSHLIGITYGISKTEVEVRLKQYAPMVKIDFALDRKLKSYSKGMLQRVGLLVCLISRPKLLILDEPVSGVDPVGRKEIKDIIVEFRRHGGTVFFSSHIISDVEEICEKVIFLKGGKVQFNDRLINILSKYQTNDFTINFYLPQAAELNMAYKAMVKLQSDLYQITVKEVEKDQVITNILQHGGSIHLVEREKKSLEEVLYVENK
jgi:ABC-2 type transport system ATP-binding protein